MVTIVSRRFFCSTARSLQPWLFVGLGNPGDKYQRTRHNVGFGMIDVFAESQGIQMDSVHCKAILGKGFGGVDVELNSFVCIWSDYMPLTKTDYCYMTDSGFVGDVPIFLAKPQTYMNLSGESLHDDMELPCGVLRLSPKGGHGSHNGLKSVIHHFRGNKEFPRLRIGIGRPPGQMDPKAFVLQQFNATSQRRIDVALQEGASALKLLVSKGLVESARTFNTDQKYKHLTA